MTERAEPADRRRNGMHPLRADELLIAWKCDDRGFRVKAIVVGPRGPITTWVTTERDGHRRGRAGVWVIVFTALYLPCFVLVAAVGLELPWWVRVGIVAMVCLFSAAFIRLVRIGREAVETQLDRYGPPVTEQGTRDLKTRGFGPWHRMSSSFRGVEITGTGPLIEVCLVAEHDDGTEADRTVSSVVEGRSAASKEARRQLAAHPDVARVELVARDGEGEPVVLFHIDQGG